MDSGVKLNTSKSMPAVGFGTWNIEASQTADAVGEALRAGYRLIDTAKLYGNEAGVGEAVRNAHIPREDIFVTTKLWNDDQGYDSALQAFDTSLARLGLEYIDLYLIHWPATDERSDSWRALCEIYRSGRAKAIGVSNYNINNLHEVFELNDVIPAVNQIEFHPFNFGFQKATVEFCNRHNIVVEAYSPLRRFAGEGNGVIERVAQKVGRPASQVILRWCIQHGTVPLPRSTNPQHIQENFQVLDFQLSDEDMHAIDGVSA
ncbi:MAG TPA: aldo/keto reductase [Candidatus Saccharimonadales bacterium]|nr:aldo/keto reductase [Candidatus Saccharimonadales bacterium]